MEGQQTSERNLRIDSIRIEKNWMTWDRIILKELGFKKGDVVSMGMIDTAERKIWNIGNFATVKLKIDTLPGHRHLLRITAKDIFNIAPTVSPHGSGKDYTLDLGIIDNNFIGSNVKMDFRFSYGTNILNYNVNVFVPRQLLYKNMTLGLSFGSGQGRCYRYKGKEKISGTGYRLKGAGVSIGNPNKEDYSYTFTPDVSIGWFTHETDNSMIEKGLSSIDYKVSFVNIDINENMGTVDTRRNQHDGFSAHVGASVKIGMNKESKNYGSVDFGFYYAKLFNRYVELDVGFNSGFTSTDIPSMIFYKGAADIKGIMPGQVSGKTFYTSNLTLKLTYISKEWIVVEQSFLINVGNGKDKYSDLFVTRPAYSVGTGFLIYPPMITGVVILFYFAYSPLSNNWYYIGY